MSVATETKIRELRILWVSRLDGSLGMAWIDDESHLVDRAPVGGDCDGR
jgi:hypothetical protein